MKVCSHCKVEKPLSDFQRDLYQPDGYQHRCRECHRSRSRTQRHTHSNAKKRRFTSPYERMSDVLRSIEEHVDDPDRVREIIAVARDTYKLH